MPPMRNKLLKSLATPLLDARRGSVPETFGMAVIDEKRAVGIVLHSVGGPDRFCFSIENGFVFPLHTSAPGKAFIAALPEDRCQALLERMVFPRFTPRTITSRAAFDRELNRIRKAGLATDLSEETVGCHCGGVAVRDAKGRPVAALWVTGMAKRLPPAKLRACIRTLQRIAADVEAALRGTKRPDQQKSTTASACVTAAKDTLSAQPPDQPADFHTLARACGVSYSTLRTAFQKETGTTLGQYRLARRLDSARRLLAETDLSITEIAERTGFCNQKHFSALFRRKQGTAPLAYRKRAPHLATSLQSDAPRPE